MTTRPLDDYFAALERLKKGRPNIVPKGTKINNDWVALEAGRKNCSIKKSRAVHADLIKAIDEAATEQAKPKNEQKERLDKAKNSAGHYRLQLEAALVREISLLYELYETKKELARLTGEKVIPIRGRSAAE
jgi:hypothetical protein